MSSIKLAISYSTFLDPGTYCFFCVVAVCIIVVMRVKYAYKYSRNKIITIHLDLK